MLKVPFLLCEAGFIEISRVTVEYPMTWSARSSHLLRSFCSRVSARSRESNRHMTHFQMVQGGISSSGASGKTGTCEGTGVFSRDSAKPVPCACTSGVSSWHPVTCHDMRTCPILSQEAPRLKIINVDGAHRDVLMGFTGGMAMGTWPKWAPTLDHHPPLLGAAVPARPTPWVRSSFPRRQPSRPHPLRITSPNCASDCWANLASPCLDPLIDLIPFHPQMQMRRVGRQIDKHLQVPHANECRTKYSLETSLEVRMVWLPPC